MQCCFKPSQCHFFLEVEPPDRVSRHPISASRHATADRTRSPGARTLAPRDDASRDLARSRALYAPRDALYTSVQSCEPRLCTSSIRLSRCPHASQPESRHTRYTRHPCTRHSTALCTIGRFAYRPTARLRTSSDTRRAHSHARRQHTQHHSHKGTHRTTRLANPDHTRDTQAH